MPTFNDLYYADMGNSKLNPEYVTQYDAGFAYTKTWENHLFYRFKIQADGYFNKVKDKIIAYPKGQQFRWTMLNLGKVEIKGIDVSTETTVNPVKDLFVTLRIQYTYQKAKTSRIPRIPITEIKSLISLGTAVPPSRKPPSRDGTSTTVSSMWESGITSRKISNTIIRNLGIPAIFPCRKI